MKMFDVPRLLMFGLVLGGLAACGSDQSKIGTTTAIKTAASSLTNPFRSKQAPAPASIGLTRAALANIVTPVDLVTIERRGAQGVIAKIATNKGVETWSSLDNKTLALRGGVVLGTRGLGEDLMAAAAPQVASLRGGSSAHTRVHTLLDGEDKPVYQRFECRTNRAGADSITVVERAYATQHITENCTGPTGNFTNDFWFETGGKLRKSRQWISNTVGFVVIEHLQ